MELAQQTALAELVSGHLNWAGDFEEEENIRLKVSAHRRKSTNYTAGNKPNKIVTG